MLPLSSPQVGFVEAVVTSGIERTVTETWSTSVHPLASVAVTV